MEDVLLLLSASNFAALDMSIQKSVYCEFYTLVYRPILYMVKNHATTEDIIQEAFLKSVRDMPNIESMAQLRGWINVVVRNTTINYLRKSKNNRNNVDIESVFMDDGLEFWAYSQSIESEVELSAVSAAITGYMLKLKPEYRILIEMRWKQELSYKEIAAELGLTESAVKVSLHRARETIKKFFLKEWGDRG